MFEGVNTITLSTQGNGNVPPPNSAPPLQPIGSTTERDVPSDNALAGQQAAQTAAEEKKPAEENRQVSEEMLRELEQDIQVMHQIGLKFSKHDETGRTMIKVMNRENDEIIREIPGERVLDLAAKIDEMIGILFDKEV